MKKYDAILLIYKLKLFSCCKGKINKDSALGCIHFKGLINYVEEYSR